MVLVGNDLGEFEGGGWRAIIEAIWEKDLGPRANVGGRGRS